VNVGMLPEETFAPGDWIIIHMGFAVEKTDRAGAEQAMAGLERWKARHPEVWRQLEPADVLVDAMRGRSSLWYRIRLNLRHVPEAQRPPQEPPEVDYDPWTGFRP